MTLSRPALHLPYSVYLASAKLTTDAREGLQSQQACSDRLQQGRRSANLCGA